MKPSAKRYSSLWLIPVSVGPAMVVPLTSRAAFHLNPMWPAIYIGALSAVGFVGMALYCGLKLYGHRRSPQTLEGGQQPYWVLVLVCSLCAVGLVAKLVQLPLGLFAS